MSSFSLQFCHMFHNFDTLICEFQNSHFFTFQIEFLNAKDFRGRTALHAAATNDNETCTRILLQAGGKEAKILLLPHW